MGLVAGTREGAIRLAGTPAEEILRAVLRSCELSPRVREDLVRVVADGPNGHDTHDGDQGEHECILDHRCRFLVANELPDDAAEVDDSDAEHRGLLVGSGKGNCRD